MTDKKRIAKNVKPSDFYWAIGILLTLGLLIYNKVAEGDWFVLTGAIIIFILSEIIGHNRKIREKFDYE